VNGRTDGEPLFSEPLPNDPWPVAARDLLTERERSLYQSLLSLYPDHKVFVQVALSQLIDVPEFHPERQSIRNRFSQLVADFVLCRSDLSVVAVIELDDRSHRRADRQRADARKTKALEDGGLRLVRVPAGALPSVEKLQTLVDAVRPASDRSDIPEFQRFLPAESVLQLADDWGSVRADISVVGPTDSSGAESRMLKLITLKLALGVVVFVGGWIFYSQYLPFVIQRAFQPLAGRQLPASSALPTSSATSAPARISPLPVAFGPSAEELAEQKRAQLQEAAALQKQKELTWAASYSAPVSCDHPVDWNAQVECGNQYMRAKKLFEQRWAAEHALSQSTGAAVVLDNGSIGGSQSHPDRGGR
jgi:very-short-patch-repair endonuclease